MNIEPSSNSPAEEPTMASPAGRPEPRSDSGSEPPSDLGPVGIVPGGEKTQAFPSEPTQSLHRSAIAPANFPHHDRYLIVELLGTGAMGSVYRAEDSRMGRNVALKIANSSAANDPELLDRFRREVQISASLVHPNIVHAYDAGEINGCPFLVMEFVPGINLYEFLQQRGPLEISEACEIAHQVALGLQHAHERGLIHRDIKPSNLILTPDGQVKILDMGLARPHRAGHGELTAGNQFLGTADYMAPEQWDDSRSVDIRSDIYSLGCTLHALLAGRPPFHAGPNESIVRKMKSHLHVAPTPIRRLRPDVPQDLERIILRMLAKDRKNRFINPGSVAVVLEPFAASADLIGLFGGSSLTRRRPSLGYPTPKRRFSRRAVVLASLGAAGGVAGIGYWLGRSIEGDGEGRSSGLAYADRAAAGREPIVVGILHSLTGTMAASETSVVDATLFAIDEINDRGGVLGRRIEPIVADGQSDADQFALEAAKLIDEHGVVALFGCWTSASRKTVRPIIEAANHLLFYPVQYEGLEQSPNIIYLGAAPNQQIIPAVRWCLGNLGQTFYLVGSDYVFPRTACEIMKDEIAARGAEVVGERFFPLGTLDVAQAVAEIVRLRPRVILNTINGDSNVAFMRELRQAGIESSQIATVSFSLSEVELAAFGSKTVTGDYAAWNYFQAIESGPNRRFVDAFRARFGARRVISDPMEAAYVAVQFWARAVKAAGTTDPVSVRAAIRGQSFLAPEGQVRIDPENNHCWKTFRMGRVDTQGHFEIVASSERPLRPEPYPDSRSPEEWNAFLDGLYQQWNGWAKPND